MTIVRNTPTRYTAYDIRHNILQADTHRLLHMNAPHVGNRYCIVLYNKNLNYVGTTLCERSNEIMKQLPVETHYLQTVENEEIDCIRKEFVKVLGRTRFLQDRTTVSKPHSKYGNNYGYFISFGISATRKNRVGRSTRKAVNANNVRYKTLYKQFVKYVNTLHPGIFGENGMYHACIIAKNSMCQWHRDSTNIGHASLTAVGDFVDGALLIEDD